MERSEPLRDMAEQISGALAAALSTGALLERHGDLIVLREGVFVYALGLLSNGEKRYF